MTHKPKRGRPVGPNGPRVKLAGRDTYVDPSTRMFLRAMREAYGFPIGRTIDQLVRFARSRPDFRLDTSEARPSLVAPYFKPIKGEVNA